MRRANTAIMIAVVAIATTMNAGVLAAQRDAQVKPSHVLPRVTAWDRPEYPTAALDADVTGDVQVYFQISEAGELLVAEAFDGPEPLRAACEEAVKKWEFRSASAGEPRGTIATTITFEFVEDGDEYFATPRLRVGGGELPAARTRPAGERQSEKATAGTSAVHEESAAPGSANLPVAKKAQITNRPRPVYTEQARQNHTSGGVVVRVQLGGDRTVKSVRVVRGLPDGLNGAALDAARSLEFDPAQDATGTPIDSWVTVSVEFTIR